MLRPVHPVRTDVPAAPPVGRRVARNAAGREDLAALEAAVSHPVLMVPLVAAVPPASAVNERDLAFALLAHELRAPLSVVSMVAHLLGLPEVPDGGPAVLGQRLERQASYMLRLVDDLMDHTRLAQGLLRVEMAPLDLRAVLTLAAEQAQPAATGRGQRLHVEMPSHPLPALGDAHRLTQVMGNLLANAVKFTPEEGLIRLAGQRLGTQAVLTVQDSGRGIDAALLPHVFELFRQADTPAVAPGRGLGLGLSLAQRLVALHGGQIGAHSDGAGQGSTFRVALPIAAAR